MVVGFLGQTFAGMVVSWEARGKQGGTRLPMDVWARDVGFKEVVEAEVYGGGVACAASVHDLALRCGRAGVRRRVGLTCAEGVPRSNFRGRVVGMWTPEGDRIQVRRGRSKLGRTAVA